VYENIRWNVHAKEFFTKLLQQGQTAWSQQSHHDIIRNQSRLQEAEFLLIFAETIKSATGVFLTQALKEISPVIYTTGRFPVSNHIPLIPYYRSFLPELEQCGAETLSSLSDTYKFQIHSFKPGDGLLIEDNQIYRISKNRIFKTKN
jgi:hypothetical protein